jgi:hypothetical protein
MRSRVRTSKRRSKRSVRVRPLFGAVSSHDANHRVETDRCKAVARGAALRYRLTASMISDSPDIDWPRECARPRTLALASRGWPVCCAPQIFHPARRLHHHGIAVAP